VWAGAERVTTTITSTIAFAALDSSAAAHVTPSILLFCSFIGPMHAASWHETDGIQHPSCHFQGPQCTEGLAGAPDRIGWCMEQS
jgi:hypothetical protein